MKVKKVGRTGRRDEGSMKRSIEKGQNHETRERIDIKKHPYTSNNIYELETC